MFPTKCGIPLKVQNCWPEKLERLKKIIEPLHSKVVSTYLWNTPRATFANMPFKGIPFIVGGFGGLPNGCAISGCGCIFLG